ncbi:MAG: type II secretion system protein, partial [Clostridia bacterium]
MNKKNSNLLKNKNKLRNKLIKTSTNRASGLANKGITLIALVVTIVVLLILAAVSLNLVLGNNGLITKSKDAKDQTEMAQIKD